MKDGRAAVGSRHGHPRTRLDPPAGNRLLKQHSPQSSLAEVDRYISWPAQALSYKLGEPRIRELRAKAERELGARFDVRDFNDAVIRDGRLPLDLLTEQIDRFIAASR